MKIKIEEIRQILSKNNISYNTNIKDGDSFTSIHSILAADTININEVIFEKLNDLKMELNFTIYEN